MWTSAPHQHPDTWPEDPTTATPDAWPAVPGGAYVDMDGTVLEGPAYPEDPLDVLDPPVLSPRL